MYYIKNNGYKELKNDILTLKLLPGILSCSTK